MFNTPYIDASPYKVKDSWWISSSDKLTFLPGLYWIMLDTCDTRYQVCLCDCDDQGIMTPGSDIIFFTALLATLCTRAFSIKCLQCTSIVDRDCYSGNVPARQCDSSVDHCIKYFGAFSTPPDVVVLRDCNKRHMDNVCITRVIEDQPVRVCYGTCNTDGCNGGHVSDDGLMSDDVLMPDDGPVSVDGLMAGDGPVTVQV